MKLLNTRPKKILFWIFISIIAFVALVILFISPLTKWAIEKYDVKYSGREITLDLAYVNPFTGGIYLKNIRIYEARSDSLFFSAASLSADFEMLKLFSKTYEISEITLTRPVIKIIQNKKKFNFDDIVETLSSKDTLPDPRPEKKEPVHFNFFNARIKDGTFYYVEQSVPVNYYIKEVTIETNGKRWDTDTMGFHYFFVSGVGGGNLQGTFDMNMASLDFKLTSAIRQFQLSALEQYVNDISRSSKVRGILEASLEAQGNFKSSQNLVARGPLSISDFHFGKTIQEDYFSFKKVSVDIVQLSPSNKKYIFDSVVVQQPYFKYERYDHLDNLQDMFGEKGEEVKESKSVKGKTNILFQIGEYVQALAKNFFKSDYKLKRLAIYDADLRYNDYTLNEKFAAAVSPLTVIADSIERSDKWVNLHLRTGLRPYGTFALNLSINPKDSSDFNLDYHLRKVSLAMFNPYFVTFTSFPVDRGIVEFNGKASVNNGVIDCNNHLVVVDPRVNNRQKRNGSNWLPLRVFMFLARERGNVIDYEIPIKGDLRDPKFRIKDAILDVLRNIFIKPITVPYGVKVRQVENEIEKSITLKWVMRKAELNPPQEKFIRRVAEFLEENPDQVIRLRPEQYTEREKEYILFFEAKKSYYLAINKIGSPGLSDRDSANIEQLDIRDPSFTTYLNEKAGKDWPTLQEKCSRVVGAKLVERKLKQLNKQRRDLFLSFFEVGAAKRVRWLAVKDTVPFNGFSQYRIHFQEELPRKVEEAYEKMNELDSNSPRRRFKAVRDRNRRQLDIE
jgi:hypothetical protein